MLSSPHLAMPGSAPSGFKGRDHATPAHPDTRNCPTAGGRRRGPMSSRGLSQSSPSPFVVPRDSPQRILTVQAHLPLGR